MSLASRHHGFAATFSCEGQRTCCLQDCIEFLLWELVVRWAQSGSRSIGSDSAGPQRELAEVELALPLIRFPLMSEAELDAIAVHPLARSSRLLSELLAEARAAHADAARAEELQVLTSPAICTCCEIMFRSEGFPISSLNPLNGTAQLSARCLVWLVLLCCPSKRTLPSAVNHCGRTAQAKGSPLLVEDGRHVRLQASAAEAAAATRFQRRHSPACQELMYVSDGDRNGVCHFLGRACGTQQWVNPVVAGAVTVRHPPLQPAARAHTPSRCN